MLILVNFMRWVGRTLFVPIARELLKAVKEDEGEEAKREVSHISKKRLENILENEALKTCIDNTSEIKRLEATVDSFTKALRLYVEKVNLMELELKGLRTQVEVIGSKSKSTSPKECVDMEDLDFG